MSGMLRPSEKLRMLSQVWGETELGRHPAVQRFLAAHHCIASAIEFRGDHRMLQASHFVVDRLIEVAEAYFLKRRQMHFQWKVALRVVREDKLKNDYIFLQLGLAHLEADLRQALEEDLEIREANFFADEEMFVSCVRRHAPGDSGLHEWVREHAESINVKAIRTYYFYRTRPRLPSEVGRQALYHLGSVLPVVLTQLIRFIGRQEGGAMHDLYFKRRFQRAAERR